MIHLDTNFLIGSVEPRSTEEALLKQWLLAGESVAASSVAWAEFLNGPVKNENTRAARELLAGRIVPFGMREAEKAAELFNQTGRKRGSQPDCFIAATAICFGVPLATLDRKDFQPFVPLGLKLA